MKERPIIFSGEMVRAILDGRKTQTRRVIKPQPLRDYAELRSRCPHGVPGDRLWVRETHGFLAEQVLYRADVPSDFEEYKKTAFWRVEKWRPSIHMPRWASRITLEITGVRVELVQRIGLGDITAEGIQADLGPAAHSTINDSYVRFIELWDSINAKRGYGWDTNPWVWVLEFKQKEN